MLKVKSINLRPISTYRTELMGIAATLIIFCHAPANGVLMPSVIDKILRSWGGLGVDMFLFLSGIGMYYSLLKRISLKAWYYHRYMRILVPYMVLSIPYYVFRWIVDGGGILMFFENVSTISFWTRHHGAWFVALLFPLYLLTPWISGQIEDGKNRGFSAICLCVCSIIGSLIPSSNSVINNIQMCLGHVPAFIYGYWLGKYVLEDKKIMFHTMIVVSFSSIFLYFVFMYLHIPKDYLLLFPILVLLSFLFRFYPLLPFRSFFFFMGTISLESYLVNIFLPVVLRKLGFLEITNFDSNRYFFYSIVIFVGFVIAYLGHLLSKWILSCCQYYEASNEYEKRKKNV